MKKDTRLSLIEAALSATGEYALPEEGVFVRMKGNDVYVAIDEKPEELAERWEECQATLKSTLKITSISLDTCERITIWVNSADIASIGGRFRVREHAEDARSVLQPNGLSNKSPSVVIAGPPANQKGSA